MDAVGVLGSALGLASAKSSVEPTRRRFIFNPIKRVLELRQRDSFVNFKARFKTELEKFLEKNPLPNDSQIQEFLGKNINLGPVIPYFTEDYFLQEQHKYFRERIAYINIVNKIIAGRKNLNPEIKLRFLQALDREAGTLAKNLYHPDPFPEDSSEVRNDFGNTSGFGLNPKVVRYLRTGASDSQQYPREFFLKLHKA